MDLSKYKDRKAAEHRDDDYTYRGGVSPEYSFRAGWAAAEELYRPLLEAVESYARLPDGRYDGPDDIYENLGEPAREALSKLRKAGE